MVVVVDVVGGSGVVGGGASVVVVVGVLGVVVVVVVVVFGSIVLTGGEVVGGAAVVVLDALLVVTGVLAVTGSVASTGVEESSSEPLSLEPQAAARTAITTTAPAAFDQLLRIIVNSLLRSRGGFGVTVRINIEPTDYFCLLFQIETGWGLVFAHGMATRTL